jgi:hypothetical protein
MIEEVTEQAVEREIISNAIRKDSREGMKPLIAIVSCRRDIESHETIRETWAKDCPVDFRFFLGRGCEALISDEVILDVPDDWNGLPQKTQAVCRWAFERDFDFVFKTDTDSYVSVPRLLESGFEKYHYSGCCGETANIYPDACFPANGGGYWLSRKAFGYLADNMNLGLGKNCEDWCVFLSLMKGSGIFVHHDPRYRANREVAGRGPAPGNDYIILHDTGNENLRNPVKMLIAHEVASCCQ